MNKKKLLSLLIVLIMCATAIALVACSNPDSMVISAAVIIGEEVFNIEKLECTSNSTAEILLDYLVENNDLHLKYTESAYGKFITEIGSLIPQGSQWISFYTSVESDKDITEYATTIKHGDATLYSAGVGISSAKLVNNGLYAFKLIG